jgi:transposase-like protein
MQYTTKWGTGAIGYWLGSRLSKLAMAGLVLATLQGHPLVESLGWVTCPPQVIELAGAGRGESRARLEGFGVSVRAGWEHLRHTWVRALARSELLAGMWLLSNRQVPGWVWLLPWLEWLLEGICVAWPWLGQQAELRWVGWGLGWLRWGSGLWLGGEVARHWLRESGVGDSGGSEVGRVGLLAGCGFHGNGESVGGAGASPPEVEMVKVDGGYLIRLRGEFYLAVKGNDAFRLRQAILFLRQLEGPSERRGSRATRDGRRPLVAQQQLAAWFEVPQPHISRWEKYWQAGDWANLLSLHSAQVLTVELRDQIVDVLARFPWWGQEQVYEHLRMQGVAVTHSQVRQAARDSGWARLRATMSRFFVVSPECIRPRDEGLVKELLAQVHMLLSQLEAGQSLARQVELEMAHLQTACAEVGLTSPPAPPAAAWAHKVKWLLLAAEAGVAEGEIRCTYCGGTRVRPKGRKPRLKRYRDENGQWQTIEVYRYRCDNPDCAYGSFTHLPLGLLPYSAYRLEMHLAALQMYAWGRSSYRRTAQALGVRAGRAYQWVAAFGQELLPVAALFGVVRCSGVVGVDEKWVQVPDKAPRGSGRSKPPKPRRWMYVYLAVDVYTYDLLHIAIYAHNTADSTRAFLLALRAKGYQPRVIVTDLRREYGPAIQEVFSHARHHECIFHAMQWMHRQLKEIYGSNYAETHPQAAELKKKMDAIFQTKTRRTAQKRYDRVMALRTRYVTQQPDVASVFDSLERHWPTLVNGIESTIIPRTNNTVELVIRRFDQHYQNFCGFDSLDSARLFLAVFEKVYRFTPFTQDAQPRIRGKCPLQLAGYDISQLSMAHIGRGWALGWPPNSVKEAVPNA